MSTTEERSIPYICSSSVNFHPDIDENELKTKSIWNPDWTIQKEMSITIDKSLTNKKTKICSKKVQFIIVIIVLLVLIFAIILPIILLLIYPHFQQQL